MSDAPSAATGLPIELPIIDISKATPEVGRAMLDAATKYGFLYVDGASSDFSNEDVESAFEMSRKFFASPLEEKSEVEMQSDNKGWSGMHSETLDPEHQQRGDFKEVINIGAFKDGKPIQKLPRSLAPREAEVNQFIALCQQTCNRILTLLALGLEVRISEPIPADWFTVRHDKSKGPNADILRFLFYPSIKAPSVSSFQHGVDVRAGAHSDYGSVTLLFQRDGQPGLEILASNGEWCPVPIRPKQQQQPTTTGFPPILVNIGDILSFWTNGLLKSTVHRVIFPIDEQMSASGRDRYSIAYFCHPLDDTELTPVPSRLVEEHKRTEALPGPTGDNITAGMHLAHRLEVTYGRTRSNDKE
ncbi:hypothetical protein LOZ57_004458 [Ophidiomyces ophidiicola]|uniref:uncharacterized protein n=1 Tax=Ophidiomyces ophidiicola TaxID=1387563 RepID=UPI0020C51EC9|nr:uncharacterized protein LOZ57_004458 [Ophidiomyces ophidiicola]KAI1945160.1 hypothetical protein LOZ57_004458 [Ophidiomyces ophidiicola]KAI2051444.1 hypothetical protein LOZ43_004749 [Ophidiomyces ophidiicola]